jgi:hypothetical protein
MGKEMWCGARAEAIDWLENDIRLGFLNYPYLSNSPLALGLKDDPRFKKVLEHVRLQWKQSGE